MAKQPKQLMKRADHLLKEFERITDSLAAHFKLGAKHWRQAKQNAYLAVKVMRQLLAGHRLWLANICEQQKKTLDDYLDERFGGIEIFGICRHTLAQAIEHGLTKGQYMKMNPAELGRFIAMAEGKDRPAPRKPRPSEKQTPEQQIEALRERLKNMAKENKELRRQVKAVERENRILRRTVEPVL